jgi:uroporphyrinogen decarboxylase
MTEMTSRERILATLRCQEADRVPFLEVLVDELVALALLGKPQPQSPIVVDEASGAAVSIGMLLGGPRYSGLDLARTLGLDVLGMNLWAPNEIVYHEINGRRMAVDGRIKTRADLNRLSLPDPDDPALYEPLRQFIAQYRDTDLALFCLFEMGFTSAMLSMGLQNFAMAVYDDRSLVEDLFELYTDWYARVTRNVCALDFDFLWYGDDIAFKTSPFVSPRMFKELFMPHYRRVATQITKPWILHSDGNLTPLLDTLLELGMNGLHPIEPGAMDLAETKRRYGKRVCLCGRISVDTLSRGTPQEVDELVKEAIRIAAPGGGYIAGSSNSIAYYCRPENVRAMQQAILQYGRYPVLAGAEP